MKKSIITVGLEIPGGTAKAIPLNSKLSLLDYDIAIFNPCIGQFCGYYEEYLGKPCLNDSNSFQLKEHLEHWRREILEAVKAGKTVFLLLNELEEVYVATGRETYSGTGKNTRTTRHVDIQTNYAIVPGGIAVVNTKGQSMRLCGSQSPIDAYWSDVSPLSEYRVLLSGDGVRPLVMTKTGEKTVGAYLRYKNASGALVLLPYVDFERKEFDEYRKEDKKHYWTEKALQSGLRFVSGIVGIDKALREKTEVSPAPEWTALEQFSLPKEQRIREDLLKLEERIESIQKDKEAKKQELSEEVAFKRLLYEKGKPLEAAIRDALQVLGFDVSHFDNGDSEFDVVFECVEGRLVGEAEGKDNKPINIDKLRQLEMNIHEDYAREEVKGMAKGALIGNAYRLTKPDDRGDFFTEKCLTAAQRSQTALVRSIDLFSIVQYLTGNQDKGFAKKCRQAILESVGMVNFPPVPEPRRKQKTKADGADKDQ
jgi:hypothetical protein